MRALLPVGGIVDHRFGILTAPNHKGIPAGITSGMQWAADIGCKDGPEYVKRANLVITIRWLNREILQCHSKCLFIAGYDVVGDAERTIKTFEFLRWSFLGWPLAFCAQDGQEDLELPDSRLWETLFVGGSTEWKTSESAYSVILEAQRLEKHIHIGRVNWWKRYEHFASMPNSERWTFDGTRTRYDGTQKTLEAWADYMERDVQLRLPIPCGDCGRQPHRRVAGSMGNALHCIPVHRPGPDG